MSTPASRSGSHASRTRRHGALVELLARLDDRRERRARHRVQRHVRIDARHRLLVGAAGHRRGRRQQPDAPAARRGHGLRRLRAAPRRARPRPSVVSQHPRAQARQRGGGRPSCTRRPAASRAGAAAPRRSPPRSARAPRASARRRESGRCRPGTGSPRAAAARAARAAPSARRRPSRTRRSAARAGRMRLADALLTRAIIPERYRRGIVRALVVSNMLPDAAHPERGSFVRDQVAALRSARRAGRASCTSSRPARGRWRARRSTCAEASPPRQPATSASTSSTPTSA